MSDTTSVAGALALFSGRVSPHSAPRSGVTDVSGRAHRSPDRGTVASAGAGPPLWAPVHPAFNRANERTRSVTPARHATGMTNEGRCRASPTPRTVLRSPVRSSGAQGALAALLIDPLAPVQREVNSRRRFPLVPLPARVRSPGFELPPVWDQPCRRQSTLAQRPPLARSGRRLP